MKGSNKLDQLAATAICGNDITSSCLYVSALSITYAGQYAWISLLVVSGVLYLFRKIYGEAVGALPLNGGAYNILLNTTAKKSASVAACLTILSYMATAVISASEAIHYLQHLVHNIPIFWATAMLLLLFMMLIMMGIKESSGVAIFIFILHLSSIALLIIISAIYLFNHGTSTFQLNFNTPLKGSISSALFLGFSTAMLGISGFESSANFVEEQKPGVFRKTLKNMWLAVSIINPLIALAVIAVFPLATVGEHQESLLSYLGQEAGGSWLATLISIDAVLVLCGAVLTSFIGVTGLMKRMTLDRIFPQFLIKENKRGSSPRILLLFFLMCLSVLMITKGKLGPLAGVYTISFLLVMAYFGYGNLLLKIKRSKLFRPEIARPYVVVIAIIAIVMAIYGNISIHSEYLVVFLQYFIPSILIINVLLSRNFILQYVLYVVQSIFDSFQHQARKLEILISRKINHMTSQNFVYFSKGENISGLNSAIQYVQNNEITRKLRIVTVLKENATIRESFLNDINSLDRAYPEIDIEFIQLEGEFGPELINRLSKDWNIPTNFMFISAPGNKFPYKISDMNGVRLIM